jgi:hypothetical protein
MKACGYLYIISHAKERLKRNLRGLTGIIYI